VDVAVFFWKVINIDADLTFVLQKRRSQYLRSPIFSVSQICESLYKLLIFIAFVLRLTRQTENSRPHYLPLITLWSSLHISSLYQRSCLIIGVESKRNAIPPCYPCNGILCLCHHIPIKSLVILWVLGSIIEVNPKYYPVPKRAWFLIAGALHAFDGILRVKGYLISNGIVLNSASWWRL